MRYAVAAALVMICLALASRGAVAQEGWRITSARIEMRVTEEGRLAVREDFAVDFGPLDRHGIFRDLITKQKCEPPDAAAERNCPKGRNRRYPLDVRTVTVNGAATEWELLKESNLSRIKIGDPDRTARGKQDYHIEYVLESTLNSFDDHDELFWNVLGEWPVPIEKLDVEVILPAGTALRTDCFEGFTGSTARCEAGASNGRASFAATRPLAPYEQVTLVVGWAKGVVDVQAPVLEDPRTPGDFFTLDPWEWGGMGLMFAAALAALAWLWWRFGRDRAYRTLYYLTNDPGEGTRPLFARRDVVVEYLPPEDLRPAQMGVLLDERADTLDVTATIVDLAVRGYLHITEVPKKGWFGKRDWKLTKQKEADDALLAWERELLDALFDTSGEVKVSALKEKFYKDLAAAQKAMRGDAVKRKWFRMDPEKARGAWRGIGAALVVAGAGLGWLSGFLVGRALILAPVALGGALLFMLAGTMPRRTAAGSEALRRVLGFRLYVATAEKRMQEFNEEQNIFARYLPYAMVFGCVEKWAKALEQLGARPDTSTAGWYSGAHAFQASSFSRDMQGFSSSMSSAISSTPGGSGGSGFGGGGSSGGGGGGGGGGSW